MHQLLTNWYEFPSRGSKSHWIQWSIFTVFTDFGLFSNRHRNKKNLFIIA